MATAIAAIASGVVAALAVAAATGGLPTLRLAARPASEDRTARLLREAGVAAPPLAVHAVGLCAGLVVVASVAVLSGVVALGVLPGLLAMMAPRLLLQRRAGARLREVRSAWPDGVAQLSGVIRSGRTLHEALVALSADPPPPLAELLAGLTARIRAVGTIGALQAVADAAGEPVTDRVIEVLCIAHEAGGRVVPDILDDLSHGIGEEIRVAEELQQLGHEGRLNAKLVFALPWVVLVVLTAGGGPYQAFYSSSAGTAIIGVASVLSLIGVGVVSRLASRPLDPRIMVQVR